jgi:hypothetical protein
VNKEKLKELLSYTKAVLDSMELGLRNAKDQILPYSGYRDYMRKSNEIVSRVSEVVRIDAVVDTYDLDKVGNAFDTTTIQQKNMFEMAYTNLSILKSFLEQKLDAHIDQIESLNLFIQVNLRKVLFEEPERELQVQNAIEQLLIGRGFSKGIDYDRETGRVKVSIKEVVPDFILPKLGLVIEAKLVKDRAKSKSVIDEINADIQSYGKAYPYITFVIYDIGAIRDETEFKTGIEKKDNTALIIVKH